MAIAIPVYDGVDLLDVMGPHEMFSWANIDVDLVAETPGPITTRDKVIFQAPKAFPTGASYDAIWVPGGDPPALARVMGDPRRTYLDYLIDQSSRVTYVASVCEGAILLAAAGLLDGYEATTHWAFVPCFDRFPQVKIVAGNPRYHLDRNRLTGGGISSGLDEALRLIELLQGTAAAQEVQRTTQYYPCPPVASVIPPATTCYVPEVTIPPRRV